MTAADHANRIREALKHTIVEVDGYTGPDVWWKPQVEAALTALDALQAQAEDIQREYILCGQTVDRMAEKLRDIATREWRDEGGRIAAAVARDTLTEGWARS